MTNHKIKIALTALAVSSTLTAGVNAAGYKLYEQSTSAMGNAYAGRGAQITDASVGFTNPAALIHLKQAQYSFGINLIDVDGKYRNARATSAAGMPVSGGQSDNIGGISAIPHFHYYQPLSEKLGLGLSLAVPFGTKSDYDDDFVGRYFAQKTELDVVALQGALSYQLTEKLSIGGALALNYAKGTLSKYKDHGGLCELGANINNTYAQLSGGAFSDVAQDAYCDSVYQVKGDDIQPGYTLGLHYAITDQLKLALSYHSEVDYTLKGDSSIYNTPLSGEFVPYSQNPEQYWTVPTIAGVVNGQKLPAIDLTTGKQAINAPKKEASKLKLHTPQSVVFSLDHQFTQALSFQFSATWTEWSQFTDITIMSDVDEISDKTISTSTQMPENLNSEGYIGYIPEYWHNTWAYALGATYRYSDELTLKAGFARDFSPVDSKYRSARIPSDDRSWLTLGVHYQSQKKWSADFAAGMMFMDDSSVLDHEYNAQDNRIYQSEYQADYSIKAYVLSMQLNYFL
ncbi:outer membrane protein transport protein [Thalassomonas sp. RHCl1]|uniref:OmpP1/FadL family transporter n=1 Tax=Thalassomonas sp. RHCl1 TaxID=2995320 RepID=UPI00248B180D|nr:outer membrane protein transport protein [Thalassomonas sp. RHCl1]